MELNLESKRKNETYAQFFAKHLLADLLRKQDLTQDYCSLTPFEWRSNYGVFTDLPFYSSSDTYYFECSKGLYEDSTIRETEKDKLKWFDPKFNRGKLLFTPHITIFHKGQASILIYIEDGRPMNNVEMQNIDEFFDGHHVELWTVSAKEILSYSQEPDVINADQIF